MAGGARHGDGVIAEAGVARCHDGAEVACGAQLARRLARLVLVVAPGARLRGGTPLRALPANGAQMLRGGGAGGAVVRCGAHAGGGGEAVAAAVGPGRARPGATREWEGGGTPSALPFYLLHSESPLRNPTTDAYEFS